MGKILKKIFEIKEVEADVDGKTKKEIHKKQKALETSVKEGAAASVTEGLGTTFIVPFAEAIKASAFQLGVISSFSGLAGPLAQLYGSRLMLKKSRKSIVLRFVLLQALMWLPISLLAIIFWRGYFPEAIPYFLIIGYTLIFILGGIAVPAWFSWMGDLVPENDRGKYFARRNTIMGLIALIVALFGALILDLFKTKGLVFLGFAILFFTALTFRLVSYQLFKKQYVPEIKIRKESYFSFFAFIKRFDNFGKFAVYQAFFNLAIMIASPFFVFYMLRDLNFGYSAVMIISVSSSIFYLLFLPIAGKFSDKFGNLRLLYIANFCFVLTPLLWIPSRNILWLIFIPQLVAGIGNAALTISVTNFTYDSVKKEHRGICVAYLNVLIGIGVFIGSLVGGFLVSYLHPSSFNPYIFIFITASIARALVGIIFLPQIKNTKKVESFPSMHILLTHPLKALHGESNWFHTIFANKKGKFSGK